MQSCIADRRSTMWTYYDRRVAHREPGPQTVLNYFRGLGVDADLTGITAELDEVGSRLRSLPAATFVDIGAGPSGAFTVHPPGRGIALDQSAAAVRQFRLVAPD